MMQKQFTETLMIMNKVVYPITITLADLKSVLDAVANIIPDPTWTYGTTMTSSKLSWLFIQIP